MFNDGSPFFKKNRIPELKIISEDENHLLLDKPAGLGCIPDRRDMGRPSLLELLREKDPEVTFVHRLDLETSGVVMVAKNKEAMRHLSQQFKERTIRKEYITYVSSFVPFEELEVDRPVGPILRQGATTIRRKGKSSITRFVKEKTYRGFARLHCFPSTGRIHQIRIHLSDMGLPIVGDEKYGGQYPFLSAIKKKYVKSSKDSRKQEVPLLRRFALHAHRLTYTPYGAEEPVTVESPEADDMVKFAQKLEKFAK